jgi:hypothetical protein
MAALKDFQSVKIGLGEKDLEIINSFKIRVVEPEGERVETFSR